MTQEADYYFNVDDWEWTHADKETVLEDMDCQTIIRMGRLERLPDVYVAQRYNEGDDEYERQEFATREEAEAWRDRI